MYFKICKVILVCTQTTLASVVPDMHKNKTFMEEYECVLSVQGRL